MDYLGEVGIGSWEYKDYADSFVNGLGWISAGSGRIDLIGNPLGEALYTKVAFDLEDKPQIAVVPVCHTNERHSPSAWKFSNAIPSWSWNGLNGKDARVEVYSKAPIVELYVNGKKVGRKKLGKNCRFTFKVKYYDGEITAVNLDKDGKELSRNTLKTAGNETILSVLPEKKTVKKGEICFINLAYTDENGNVKPLERGKIDIEVQGGELLAAGHACPFNKDGYNHSYTDTYYGRAMAVVKATGDVVKVTANGKRFVGSCKIVTE
jgi:beta-galactosidase